tara:strand:- start:410 stop:526 length:117 start_codon:yes stop_codon:yes gene_type:complete
MNGLQELITETISLIKIGSKLSVTKTHQAGSKLFKING